jgi:hypothetical protein
MKRKGERNIPDFSRKPKPIDHTTPQMKAAPLHDRPPQPKPQATAAKSGRRGQ